MPMETQSKAQQYPRGWLGYVKNQWNQLKADYLLELETQRIAFRLGKGIDEGKKEMFLRQSDEGRAQFFRKIAVNSSRLIARQDGLVFKPNLLVEELKNRKMDLDELAPKEGIVLTAGPTTLDLNEQAWRIYRRIQNWLLAEYETDERNREILVRTPLEKILKKHMRPGDAGSELMALVKERFQENQGYFVFPSKEILRKRG